MLANEQVNLFFATTLETSHLLLDSMYCTFQFHSDLWFKTFNIHSKFQHNVMSNGWHEKDIWHPARHPLGKNRTPVRGRILLNSGHLNSLRHCNKLVLAGFTTLLCYLLCEVRIHNCCSKTENKFEIYKS